MFESELKGKGYTRNPKSIPSTPERPSGPSLEERGTPKSGFKTRKEPSFKKVGFVNRKWTEIVVEDVEECEQLDRDEVKETIIQLSQREAYNPIDTWIDKCIRAKHKTYVPVEVNKDRNGRMIYTPLKPTNKPEISVGAEIRTPKDSDDEDKDDEITEVEYPQLKALVSDGQNKDVKRSVLTKQELIKLINDEI